MEAWFAGNMWWLLPVIAVAFFGILFYERGPDESYFRRVVYMLWPVLEPGSRTQLGFWATVFAWGVVAAIFFGLAVLGYFLTRGS